MDADVEAVDVAKFLDVFSDLGVIGAIGRMLSARSAVKHEAVTDLDEDAILIAASNLLLIV